MTPSDRSPARKPLARSIAAVAAFAVIAAIGCAYASPYLVLDRLKRAADARDADIVNQYVDYPALRESLKEQVAGLLMRRIDEQKLSHPFAALGAMIGMAFVGPLVDAYATPDGVAALLNGMPPRGTPGERPPAPASQSGTPAPEAAQPQSPASAAGPTPNAPPPAAPTFSSGYRGINVFAVTYQHGAGDAHYSAILHRNGLFSWKLVAVELNGKG
jgi:hypothetical protein